MAATVVSACGHVIGDWPTEVHGLVLDEEGYQVQGAFVGLRPFTLIGRSPGAGIITGPDGRFAFSGIRPGWYVLTFIHDSAPLPSWQYLEAESPWFIVEHGKATVAPTLRLTRATAITVEGIVNTPDGQPISNATLDFRIALRGGGTTHFVRTQSDSDGRFAVDLMKDHHFVIRVNPEGAEWGRRQFVANGQFVRVTARPR